MDRFPRMQRTNKALILKLYEESATKQLAINGSADITTMHASPVIIVTLICYES
jgi:hypothetical protein